MVEAIAHRRWYRYPKFLQRRPKQPLNGDDKRQVSRLEIGPLFALAPGSRRKFGSVFPKSQRFPSTFPVCVTAMQAGGSKNRPLAPDSALPSFPFPNLAGSARTWHLSPNRRRCTISRNTPFAVTCSKNETIRVPADLPEEFAGCGVIYQPCCEFFPRTCF